MELGMLCLMLAWFYMAKAMAIDHGQMD